MEYLTALEVAAMLRIRPRTLEMWRFRKMGPGYVKIEGRVLYPKDELDRYIAARTVSR